jgi:myo-inositol-1(or 4)-monophosphatase
MPPPGVAASDRDGLARLATEVSLSAGSLLEGFARRRAEGGDLDVSAKSSASDAVSEADRATERLIAERLAAERPDDGLLGEEDQAGRSSTSGLTWVVDPLDGTVNFLYGIPMWCVSIACVDEHGPLVGVVHHPWSGETFTAVRDGGARVRRADADEARLHVTAVDDATNALVATGFGYEPAIRAARGRDVAALLPRVRDVRRAGSAALDLAWVAAGRLDAYLEFGPSAWDWAAGRLLVSEAGGRVTEHRRRHADRDLLGIVAGGETVHEYLVAWLATRDHASTSTGDDQ